MTSTPNEDDFEEPTTYTTAQPENPSELQDEVTEDE